MNPHRIVFINRFYWPDEQATAQLLTDLATALASRGFSIVVVASVPWTKSSAQPEYHEGVRIERVRASRSKNAGLVHRLWDFATFYLGASIRLWRLIRPGDFVVAMTDPPLLGILVAAVAAQRGGRLVHWVQDIYPEIAVTVTGRRWLAASRPLRNVAWRRAEYCVVPGADMGRTVSLNGIPDQRVVISENWSPQGLFAADSAAVLALRQAWGLDGKFVAVYSGNLGRVHELDTLIDVAEALRHEPVLAFVFVGGGAQLSRLKARVTTLNLQNVSFHEPQPRARLGISLAVGDVHFVTLRQGAEASVFPSKLYGIAQTGRPVIFIGETQSGIANLVSNRGFGVSFGPESTTEIAQTLRDLADEPVRCRQMGTAATTFAHAGFERALETWTTILSSQASLSR